MPQVKLVFSDIDGTLLNSQHQLTAETKEIVNHLIVKDIPMVLASARPPHAMRSIASELQLRTPLVCYNGALIVDYDRHNKFKTLFSLPIERLDTLLVYQILYQDCPDVSVSVYSEDKCYVDTIDWWNQQEAKITGFQPTVLSLKAFLKDYHPVHKILCMGEPDQLDNVIKKLDEAGILDISYYRSKSTYLELTNHSVSKLSAMNIMAKKLHINTEEIVSIGDNDNDLSMIISAGIGIAMGNAPDRVKAAANKITKSNDENGLYYALASLLR